MKKTFKRFLACFAALAILSSMVTVFADPANTVDIEKVEVLTEGSETTVPYEGDLSNQNITLTQEQLLKVTISLKTGDPATILESGDITFLSYINGTETSALADGNIQYIDQGSVATTQDHKVVVTFRPRATLEPNTFVAKAGGTDAAVDEFTYTVTAAKTALSLNAATGTIQKGDEDAAITFTMGGMTGETPDYSTVTVSSVAGETVTALTSGSDYTIDGTTLTILNAHLKDVGTYSIKISHTDYKDSNVASYTVTPAPIVIPPEDKEEVEGALDDVEIDTSDVAPVVGETTSIILPENVGTTDYKYEYSIADNGTAITDNNVVKIEDGALKYTPTADSRFAEKVVINVTVGDMAPVQKTIYLIHPEKGIAFGNITAIDSEGADIFAANATFTAAMADPAISAEVEMARAEALNIGLGKNDGSNVAAVKKTLDFDGDGTVTLAEYRIYKLMLAGDDKYLPETLKEVREQYSGNF